MVLTHHIDLHNCTRLHTPLFTYLDKIAMHWAREVKTTKTTVKILSKHLIRSHTRKDIGKVANVFWCICIDKIYVSHECSLIAFRYLSMNLQTCLELKFLIKIEETNASAAYIFTTTPSDTI